MRPVESADESFPLLFLPRLAEHCALPLASLVVVVLLWRGFLRRSPTGQRVAGWLAACCAALLVTEPAFAFGSAFGDAARSQTSGSAIAVCGWVLAGIILVLSIAAVAALLLFRNTVSESTGAFYSRYESLPIARGRSHNADIQSWLVELPHDAPAPHVTCWSVKTARLVATSLPPLVMIPNGYWTFTPRFSCELQVLVRCFPQHGFSPLVYVALHIVCMGVASLLFGLSGAHQVCLDVRRDEVHALSANAATHGILPFTAGSIATCCFLVVLAIGQFWLGVWRSCVQRVFSTLLLVFAGAALLAMSAYGTQRHGGLLGPEFFDTADDSEGVADSLIIFVVACEGVLVLVAVVAVIEHWWLQGYLDELDASMYSHLRLRESMEMLFMRPSLRRRAVSSSSSSDGESTINSSPPQPTVQRPPASINPLTDVFAPSPPPVTKKTAVPPKPKKKDVFLTPPPKRMGYDMKARQADEWDSIL